MSGLGSGLVNLFKGWGRGIGNAADKFLLDADARKAISDEVINKFKPMIERANKAESKRATNIKDLGDKLNESKKAFQDAHNNWQKNYDSALAGAKKQRQTDIADYDAKLKEYQDAIDNAEASKQSIKDQLYQQEAKYTPTRTIYTDVNTGDRYIVNPITGKYENITQTFNKASPKQKKAILGYMQGFDERLLDASSGTPKVINAFDKANLNSYHGKNNIFDEYLDRVGAQDRAALRDANSQINQAKGDLTTWQKSNNRPADWNDQTDLGNFDKNFRANNAEPTGYSFNGKNYSDEKDLDAAYQKALNHAQYKRNYFGTKASDYASERDKEIAQRIQDAKDIKKAKLALGGALGAGVLYAGAKAIYGGDDTPDNTNNTNNIDNTDNTYTGEPDPNFKIGNTPEGKAALNGKSIDSGFDPDKADALAAAAYDKGVEDSNSIESSDDHFIDDNELYGLLKAMKDPYKADAVANYIYSKHGNESDVQNLGWRGWLNKYYGDLLRSRMNIDPSGYKGMHIA